MKYLFFFVIFSFVLFSCSGNKQNEKNSDIEEVDDNPIVGKWKLHIHQKRENDNNEIDLKSQPTEVILSIMDGGYFVIYDTFVDPKFNQKGFNRISERSKGQWEFIDNKELVLHHNFEDSTRVEKLFVTTLNKNTLVTKGENKKSNIYKTYEGY